MFLGVALLLLSPKFDNFHFFEFYAILSRSLRFFMTFLMHWTFKTGYHEIAAKKFLSTGAPFPTCKSWKRFHGPGSVEGWILVEVDSANACYEHAAEWAECLDWEVTPVLTDDQAGPLIAKAYS